MAPSFTTRIIHYTILIIVISASWNIGPSLGFGEDLSSDRDLFLEDDAGSGDGRPPGFGDIDNGSGCSIDDEDFEDCKAKNAKTPPPVHQKPRYGDDVDPIPNSNEPPNFGGKSVFDEKHEANFFSQPGILAAIICGAIVGLLCAILLVMFIVYRMRKKDEGSYVLEDSKRTTTTYGKTKEFYA